MAYDHHLKAGNQGDCIKHPALVAALDAELQSRNDGTKAFHYLDFFAGHAWHPRVAGKEYGWEKGIGHLMLIGRPDTAPSSVKSWWAMWHNAQKWPTAVSGTGYPGSAWIAAHRCREAQTPIKLELYDHSPEVRRDLENMFLRPHAIQAVAACSCLIGQSLDPTTTARENIERPDFVFIDPPGWQSKDERSYPCWAGFRDQVLRVRVLKNLPTLLWTPTAGNDNAFLGKPSRKIAEAADLGFEWSAVRWQTAGSTACAVIYNSAAGDIREAINWVVVAAKWDATHSNQDRCWNRESLGA